MYPLGHDQTPLCHPSRQESVVARMLELSKFHLYIWIYTNRLLGSQPCSSLNSIAIALTIRFAGLLIKLVLSAWSSMSIGRMFLQKLKFFSASTRFQGIRVFIDVLSDVLKTSEIKLMWLTSSNLQQMAFERKVIHFNVVEWAIA